MTDEAGDAMTTTTTTYADAVRRALDDLPAARYLELVDGLDEHLAEVQADGGASLADVLGPPDAYAAELRSSAGLPPRATMAGTPLPPPVAPPPVATTAAPRAPVDRSRVARVALVVAGGLAALWVLGVRELSTLKLALITLGVLGAMQVARRLTQVATLGDRTARRVSVAIAVGGLLTAAAFGSAVSNRRMFLPGYNGPSVTFTTVPYGPLSMPDFRGLTMGDATQQASELGLVVNMVGGTATVPVMGQDPAPGTAVFPGTPVTLTATPDGARPFATTTTTVVVATTLAPTSTVPATTTLAPATKLAPATTAGG